MAPIFKEVIRYNGILSVHYAANQCLTTLDVNHMGTRNWEKCSVHMDIGTFISIVNFIGTGKNITIHALHSRPNPILKIKMLKHLGFAIGSVIIMIVVIMEGIPFHVRIQACGSAYVNELYVFSR